MSVEASEPQLVRDNSFTTALTAVTHGHNTVEKISESSTPVKFSKVSSITKTNSKKRKREDVDHLALLTNVP